MKRLTTSKYRPARASARTTARTVAAGFGILALFNVVAVLSAEPAAAPAPAPAPAPARPASPPTARAQAPFDPSGYWVSVITEDWRYRMVVPGKGEYEDVPVNLEAKQFADAWSPAADEAAGQECKAYGAGVIMRIPGRLHISWQDDNTLRVDTDAGMQTRLLLFKPTAADTAAPPSTQGLSVASWVMAANAPPPPPGSGNTGAPRHGTLKVQVSNMTAGYLRKNGLPYSENSKMTEYWDLYAAPNGDRWLVVESELTDPKYLQVPFVLSSNFKQEADGRKWDPSPCSLRR